MAKDQTRTTKDLALKNGAEKNPAPRYVIQPEQAHASSRSLPLLIASRRCYMCQQTDDEDPSSSSEIQPYIDCISEHCAEASDYLLPDTPLKEAIFRILLSGGNKPTSAEKISQVLSEKWASTSYPRDTSSKVIYRLLEKGNSYCIGPRT